MQETQPLPVDVPPDLIMPVDPMAWRPPSERIHTEVKAGYVTRDAFVSVSPDGDLCFWMAGTPTSTVKRQFSGLPGWKCTGRVRTCRRQIAMAQCSSAKKTVLGEILISRL